MPATQTETVKKKVVISCRAPQASKVLLAGEFDDWQPKKTPIKRAPGGQWEARQV